MSEHTDFSALLQRAVSEPGKIAEAYSRFWNYSLGNQLLAMFECARRGIEAGPIGTFMHWKSVGRYVRKGEKAITLCMPITVKRKGASVAAPADGPSSETEAECFTRFVFRPNWFVLAQTDGAEFTPAAPPAWDEARALAALGAERIPFDLTNGNIQGYARGRSLAVSPIAQLPLKTMLHELAHIILGHTSEGELNDSEQTPRSLREVEAEAVALLCLESLGIDGAEFCRGYLQHWLAGESIPERSAQRIFKAASAILEAGREKVTAIN